VPAPKLPKVLKLLKHQKKPEEQLPSRRKTEELEHTAVATEGEVTKKGEVGASSEAAEGSEVTQASEEAGGTVAESKETEDLEHTAVSN
jgi:hypothetical protein